jgi:cytochrome c
MTVHLLNTCANSKTLLQRNPASIVDAAPDSKVKRLLVLSRRVHGPLAAAAIAYACIASAVAADPEAGKAVLRSQCTICHTVQQGQNKTGPSLFGIVGRKTAAAPGFHYSEANQKANLTWDAATLDKYLTSPKAVVPGTAMTYPGLKDDPKRADLIAYLATLK